LVSEVLSPQVIFSLMVMSLCGVSAWWAKNILDDIFKVRIAAVAGCIAATILVLSL